jgi:hypothetical protein
MRLLGAWGLWNDLKDADAEDAITLADVDNLTPDLVNHFLKMLGWDECLA